MITNKEVIDKLVEYFKSQDIEYLSILSAHLFIDLNRFIQIDALQKEEKTSLIERTENNVMQMYSFIDTGNSDYLKLVDASGGYENNM